MPKPGIMTVREATESRRAIRKYLQQPVPEEDVREILRQVSLAPSPNNIQPWRFVVVRDPALKKQLEPAILNQRQVLSTHCLIVLYADMEDVIATKAEIVHPGITGEARAKSLAGVTRDWDGQPVEERQKFARGSRISR